MTKFNTNTIIDNDIIYNMVCNMLYGKLPIFENIIIIKDIIIKDIIIKDNVEYNIRDNISLTSLSWRIYKDANNNLDEAINIYKRNKAEYINIYQNKFKNRNKIN